MRTRKNNTERNTNGMKKRALTLAAALMLAIVPATAQIFLDDESLTNRGWLGDMDELGNIIPFHEVDWDQANYASAGGGILLLAALGGTYLVGKRRKEGSQE